MEIANILFNAENLRTLVLLVAIICGVIWQKFDILRLEHKISNLKAEIKGEMNAMFSTFHTQLKTNDFAHLNATIEALTFTLEKNGYLKPADKEYIDGRLDR